MKRTVAAMLLMGLVFQSLFPNMHIAQAKMGKPIHGSVDNWIDESQLVSTVPSDYKVNPETQGKAKDGAYDAFFLKEDLQTISIEIDENNLNYLFQNAADKPTVMADSVTIGDEKVSYVGLKTKGSYTLEHSYSDNPKSDRFSLTINFGKYVKKKDFGETQNFHGVSKISLNNFFFDKSMMKEYCSLLLMEEMGLPTPQFGLAKVYINGEYYGVYSMIESLDSPLLEQYYDCGGKDISSYICKPEGTNFIYDDLERDWSPMWERNQDTLEKVRDMIPTIDDWVKMLNQLSEGRDFDDKKIDVNSEEYLELLEQIIDVDEFVRYFAAHSFLCQLDNMFVGQKNFGLYVSTAGRALILPWDYDLSFGTYSPVTAEATANYHTDLMFMLDWGANVNANRLKRFYSDFPLFNVIYQNESLMERFHTYMLDCSKIMALGGTTSMGKNYEPAYVNNRIDTLTTPLTKAATEKVASRAGYMNGIAQPRDLKGGLQNLTKIVTMRSVGVYIQLKGIESYVSGRGCNLAQVGNGQDNWGMLDNGYLTATSPEYGFFTVAKYKGAAPQLTVKEMTEFDRDYNAIKEASKYSGEGYFKAYNLKDAGAAKLVGDYSVYVPLSVELAGKKLSFYSYEEGKLEKLTATLDENIYTCLMEKPGTLVIMENGQTFGAGGSANILYVVAGATAGILIIVVCCLGFLKIKRKVRIKRKVN